MMSTRCGIFGESRRIVRVSLRWQSDGTLRQFSAYVISNSSMTLYTGVTNDLRSRVWSHKEGSGSKFTARYHFDRLVCFETYDRAIDAIAR
ncbi:MAG: GIY-YIG nuclease family protein, partial [Thermoanaerobaculia bacterium]